MRNFFIFLILLTTVILSSCRSEFTFEPSIGNLAFSKDTVYLDTVFSNIGSSTYTLKVYNKTNKNIAIPKVRLAKGQASKYRLMVDGLSGKEFENIELLANDSLFIFVEMTSSIADANPADFLYTDQIQFGDFTNFQKVELVTLIQDAYFIYPSRSGSSANYTYEQIQLGVDANNNPITITGSNLSTSDPINGNELHWTNTKPYVIYGYAKIPGNQTLTVDAGARVHFHANSGLIVSENASLVVNGNHSTTDALENEVIFEGDRLEPQYRDVAGQWGTIWFLPGSKNNTLDHLTIKNATVGLLISGNDGTNIPTLDLKNTQIYNCTNVGILARTGNITGKNVVVNNCGQASLACTFGGKYDFTHCTFANYWSTPNQTCLVVSDDKINNVPTPLETANFKNCIFYGSANLSLALQKNGMAFNYQFTNCLIKFFDSNNQYGSNALYQFATNPKFINCIIGTNSTTNKPYFKNTPTNEFIIGEQSAAKGSANPTFSTFNDILNKPRTGSTDMGAYNYIIFN
ncbi:hypothetical protein RF683_03320 [Flavobacterium sp. 20NA77.7]|uniref:Right handed beta helix region n=1 Tax=Flavobacterium nakdongensis TaxID=3073563 RepID=A0ABY9RE56_9FLAO|nr:hypothetical protein [Flavobacterium sp. 20NA77.7]WMW78492.1 hypothetical protein RF683_03320 [Flavobacterium sp. 20NA77.7]